MKLLLGIDPGVSGGFAVLSEDLSTANVVAFSHVTPSDIITLLEPAGIHKAHLESVGAFPGQGVSSTFKFGMNYGWWQGVLVALGTPFDRVAPQKWQTAMRCLTKGDKNVSKARAQELFPALKITHATADALLIAEYGRRLNLGLKAQDL
jgi:crossover junction endodeoxyribonuclease RuvC